MTLPRPVHPGSVLLVNRRCTQRQYLLRPDPETNNAVLYCLGVASQRNPVDLMGFVQMSNHLHYEVYDRTGNAPEFYEDFHKLLAKCVNAVRGRWENFFSSEQVCVVRLASREDFIDKLVYIATNPVRAGLVARVADWPGANSYHALLTGEPIRARRPRHFFSEKGTMPEYVTFKVEIPPELGDRDEIVAEVRRRVEEVERAEASRRALSGERVLGRYAVLRQSWRDSPTSREPRRRLRPMIAAKNLWARLETIQRNRDFVNEYRRARAALLAGTPIPFPAGTYWLKRFLGVEVVEAVAPAAAAASNENN